MIVHLYLSSIYGEQALDTDFGDSAAMWLQGNINSHIVRYLIE